MGVCGCRVPNTDIPNLVAVGPMRRRMRLELWEGRRLVNHMASILGRFYQGISLKSPVTEKRPSRLQPGRQAGDRDTHRPEDRSPSPEEQGEVPAAVTHSLPKHSSH